MTTAPRLRALLPDEAVQRESSRESARSVIGSPPWGRGRAAGHRSRCRCGRAGGPGPAAGGAEAVVKWRSARRRSSEPDFQMAYSSESASADADAAMMFV